MSTTTANEEPGSTFTREMLDEIMKMFPAPNPMKIIRDPATGQHYAYDPSKIVLAPMDMKITLEPFRSEPKPLITIPWGAVIQKPTLGIMNVTDCCDAPTPRYHQDRARWIKKREQAMRNAIRLTRSNKHNATSNRARRWINLYVRYSEKAARTK